MRQHKTNTTLRRIGNFFSTELKSEALTQMKISVQIAMSCIFNFTIMTESVIMCGHFTAVTFEAVGLAMSLLNAFGFVINVGVITASETLFSQSYGSDDKKRTGMFLQRSMMFCIIHPLLLGILYLHIEPILIALGQNREVSRIAAIFLQISIPGLLFNAQYYILVRYMQTQDIVFPPVVIAFIGNVFNIVSQYLLIFVLEFDFRASSACQATTYLVQFLLAVLYIMTSKRFESTWDGFKAESLFAWKGFAGLAFAGVCHLCLEIICYEGCTFLAGIIGIVELGAQAILFQTECVIFMIPLSQGAVVNIRVGQSLGANKPKSARIAIRAGLMIAFISGTILGVLILILKDVIPHLFTNDKEVLKVAIHAFPVIAFVILMNHFLAVLNGMLRGCGLQKIGAYAVIICFNVIALPIATMMALFSNFGILGLWLGIVIGLVICFTVLCIIACRLNLEEQAVKAQERIGIKYKSKSRHSVKYEENEEESSDIYEIKRTQSPLKTTSSGISREDIIRVILEKGFLMLIVFACFLLAVLIRVYSPYYSNFVAPNSTRIHDFKDEMNGSMTTGKTKLI